MKKAYLFLFLFGLDWGIAVLVLWWAYDLDRTISGAGLNGSQVTLWAIRIAFVIALLSSFVWVWSLRKAKRPLTWRSDWNVAWKTAVVLLGYGVLIEGRRWFWTPEQGNKAFSPILNDANSFFFREFLWLIFILEVIPIAGCSSGILYHLQSLADDTLSGVPRAK